MGILPAICLAIRRLWPGYFALVMATGIISIAASQSNMPVIAWGLFLLNMAAYAVLSLMTAIRVAVHTNKVFCDLVNHAIGPGFLTTVAATCIVGSQIVLLWKSPVVGFVFWLIGLALWFLIIYSLFTGAITNPRRPIVQHAVDGSWLVATVSTESIAILGSLLAPEFPEYMAVLLFISLCMFLLGSMLYLATITLILQRLVFFPMTAKDFNPAYWINMGAAAITTLSGSSLALAAPSWTFLQQIMPFLLGFSLLFWTAASWWIPLLIVLGIWRHGLKRLPLRYGPLYWDMVFPLGMYATCTQQFARATGLRLEAFSDAFIYVALAAWLITSYGLLRRIVDNFIFRTHRFCSR